jgi:uncharacterized protein DUF6221
MVTLVDFLLARIAEDEVQARSLVDTARDSRRMLGDPKLKLLGTMQIGWHAWPKIEAMATRVLVECQAKRLLIAEHPRLPNFDPPECGVCESVLTPSPWPCATLRAMSLPFADHADYQEEWRA